MSKRKVIMASINTGWFFRQSVVKNIWHVSLYVLIISLLSCKSSDKVKTDLANIRPLIDTVGFAQYSWQMDSLMARIKRQGWKETDGEPWKLGICPHDDYTYVGKLYPDKST